MINSKWVAIICLSSWQHFLVDNKALSKSAFSGQFPLTLAHPNKALQDPSKCLTPRLMLNRAPQ